MQKFRSKQAILVMVFKAKAVYNSSERQKKRFKSIFTWNFTFDTTKKSLNAHTVIICEKMNRMDDD